jgi:acyl-CoA synthetase (AMP-forming)/AMP-acid ligase II
VLGAPSEQWGESPMAVVVVHEDSSETVEDLLVWTNDQLNKHQRLINIELIAELPRNHLGKILKKQLKAQLFPELTGTITR